MNYPHRSRRTASQMQPPRQIVHIGLLAIGLGLATTTLAQPQNQPPAADTDWQLTHLNGKAQIDPTQTTISIDAEQQWLGHAGCNRFKAEWDGTQLQATTTTEHTCAPRLAAQEQAMLNAVTQTRTMSSNKDGLELYNDEGDLLARFAPRTLPRYYFNCGDDAVFIEVMRNVGIRLHTEDASVQLPRNDSATQSGTYYSHSDTSLAFQGHGDYAYLIRGDEQTRCELTEPPKAP